MNESISFANLSKFSQVCCQLCPISGTSYTLTLKPLLVTHCYNIFENSLAWWICLGATNLSSFLKKYWPRFRIPQVVYYNSLVWPLNVALSLFKRQILCRTHLQFEIDFAFPGKTKLRPSTILRDLISDNLRNKDAHLVTATDGTVKDEKASICIFPPQVGFQFPIRLPDSAPIFGAKFMAVLLAYRRAPFSFSKVLLWLTPFLCVSLVSPCNFFYLTSSFS